jgi:hypothetical protein
VRRLAIFWLACAAIGFLAAVGAAVALSLALDGPASWRAAPPAPRVVQRKATAAPETASAPRPQSLLAPPLGSAS